MNRGVAIVDPLEAGALYAPLLAARGFTCHRVMSCPPVAGAQRRATLRREDFATATDLAQGWDEVLARLAGLRLTAVLAGHEHGVLTADRLAAALGLPGNGVERSAARRDKAAMAVAAGRAGLRVPAQQSGRSSEPLLAWAARQGRWPVVAKPARGYGSQQVERCATPAELRQALARIFDEPNALGERNATALVQEALCGSEYAVDTLSWEGEHRLAALWKYHRRDDAGRGPVPLFDAKELLPTGGRTAQRILAYVRRLLDALGVRFGPAHSEVMLVAGEPVLIEVGARLHGGEAAHTLCRLTTGDSQVEQVVRCLAHGGLDELPASPAMQGRAAILVLRNPIPGRTLDAEAQRRLAALPGVVELRWNAPPGEPAPEIAGLALVVDRDGECFAAAERAVGELELLGAHSPESLGHAADQLPAVGGSGAGKRFRGSAPLPASRPGHRGEGVEVKVLHDCRALAELAREWKDLLDRSVCNRAFSSVRWFLAWCEVAPAWEPWVFVARRRGNLAGVLALVREGGGPLRFPGELADYQDAVVARGDVETVRGLLAAARGAGFGLSLAGLRPDANLALPLDEATFAGDGKVLCPHVDLSAGYPSFFASRSASFRSQLRRAWKRAAVAGFEAAELRPEHFPARDLPALFLDLHGERFSRSCFDRPLDRAFARLATPVLFAERRLRAFALRRSDEVVAISLCMVGDESLGQWNGGWRPTAAPVSPGKLLLDLEVQICCREGCAEFDLMRGEEPYKAQWMSGSRTIGSLVEAP
jgi:biotin carboxylase/CelD/BcsL family acetyltransferase involved in cellulose biosynthesis